MPPKTADDKKMQARAYRLKKRLPEDQKAYLNDLKETDPATYTAFLAVLDKQGANPFDLAPLTPPTGVLQAALTVAPASETGKALLARFDAQVKSNQTIAQDAVQANAESYRTLVGALTQEDSRRHELSMKMTEERIVRTLERSSIKRPSGNEIESVASRLFPQEEGNGNVPNESPSNVAPGLLARTVNYLTGTPARASSPPVNDSDCELNYLQMSMLDTVGCTGEDKKKASKKDPSTGDVSNSSGGSSIDSPSPAKKAPAKKKKVSVKDLDVSNSSDDSPSPAKKAPAKKKKVSVKDLGGDDSNGTLVDSPLPTKKKWPTKLLAAHRGASFLKVKAKNDMATLEKKMRDGINGKKPTAKQMKNMQKQYHEAEKTYQEQSDFLFANPLKVANTDMEEEDKKPPAKRQRRATRSSRK